MAFTVKQLADLDKALATGARRIKYLDKEVILNSPADIERLRKLIMRDLGLLPHGPRRVRIYTDKGLDL